MTNYTPGQVGFRDATQQSQDALGHLHAGPTGRRLAIDGTFVLTYTNTDPQEAYLTASDGAAWLYEDLATGNRFVVTFTRDSGFKSVQVT